MPVVDWRGVRLDARTAAMMNEVARLVPAIQLDPTQGSYSKTVGASAGTHDGGGAIDLSLAGLNRTQILAVVKAMRQVGFAAWYRRKADGPWSPHIHGVAIGCSDLAPVARRQVIAYKQGKNGLKNNAADPQAFLGVKPTTWEAYRGVKVPTWPLPSTHAFGPKPSTTVHNGTANAKDKAAVKKIQGKLAVPVTGLYGRQTANRVRLWQAKRLMPPTGRVGRREWVRLGL